MTERETSPIRPTDDEARALAKGLLHEARYGALGVLGEGGAPVVTRIAVGVTPEGEPVTLISGLSHHTKALRADPRASVLVGEPGGKGDPLTWPRLSIQGRVRFVEHGEEAYGPLAERWLKSHPKAKLYIGFGDFVFAVLQVEGAYLNGGFGKAFVLTPQDLV